MPSNERLSQLYKTGFDYRWYADHYNAKLKDCRIRVKEYAPLLGRRVLDFGGGVGYFSSAARESGLESITYDPYISDKPPQSQHWDCVVALHVLEHSNNLDQTLSQIKDLLIPGGNLVLAVPNADGLGYQRLGMGWVWAQPPLIHIFHFTAAGLTALLSRHGFENIRISYHERWDANHEADIVHAEHFRRWDSAWALPLWRAIPGYRKLIATFNSWRRFRALSRSHSISLHEQAELQVVATLPRQ